MALFPLAYGGHWLSGSMLLAGEFLSSVGVMIFDVNQNSLMAILIPQAIRSRVVGVTRCFNYGTRPFGALLGGAARGRLGQLRRGQAHVVADRHRGRLECRHVGATEPIGSLGVEFVGHDAPDVVGLEH
jgi:hypothetical protein